MISAYISSAKLARPESEQDQELKRLEAKYQSLTKQIEALLAQGDSNPEIRAAIIRKVLHRVEVTKNGYEIFFHIGAGYFERTVGGANTLGGTGLEPFQDAKNKKRGLDTSRPPSKPLNRFFLDSCSKRLENGGDGAGSSIPLKRL